jgi:hypothetical protein
MVILLPAYINADGLLPFLSLIGQAVETNEIALDFAALR